MTARWESLVARVNAMKRRERLLLFAAIVVLLGAVTNQLFIAPLTRLQAQRAREIDTSSEAMEAQRLKLAGYLESTPDRRLAPTKRFFARPLASGFVRAGLPDPVTDDEADAVTLDDYLIERPSQTVLVRVKGDSMIDAGVFEGDLVVVEKRAAAQKGDIVVAIVDNQFTLKRLDLENGRFVLKPENKAYPVIRPEGDLEIFGVMVGLVRKL